MRTVTSLIGAMLSRLFQKPQEPEQPKPQRPPHRFVSAMPGGDQVIWGLDGADMDRAIEAAKETLPIFWAWHETRSDDPNDCALKVQYDAIGAEGEHIWLIDIRRTGELVTGLVGSEPERVPSLKLWDITVIDVDRISDWTFRKDGLHYGHFTTRVMAAAYPDVLASYMPDISPTPLPSGPVLH